jgi:archaellum component FlaC
MDNKLVLDALADNKQMVEALAIELRAGFRTLTEAIGETNEHLGETNRRLDRVETRLEGIDGRLDGIDGRLDGIDGRLDGIDGRLNGIEKNHDLRIRTLERWLHKSE